MPDANLRLTLRGVEVPVDATSLRQLGDGLGLLMDGGGWAQRPTIPLVDGQQESTTWDLQLDGSDRRRTWRELCLGVTLAIAVSRLRPGWLVEVHDETGLLSLGLHRDDPVVLRAGVATRPRRGGPPSPAADRDLELRTVLWNALGDELAERWGLTAVPPVEDVPASSDAASPPTRMVAAANQGAVPSWLQGTLGHLVIRPSVDHPGGALELSVTVHNAGAHMVHELALLVVLRTAAGEPLDVAELRLAPLSAGERRSVRRVEALAHPPADIASVEVQVRGTSRTRTHGVAALSLEPA